MKKILVLKDNFNSFEQFYIDRFVDSGIDCFPYYKNNSVIRKIMTHLGLPFDKLYYGKWKYDIGKYDVVIIFDCLHNSKLVKYVYNMSDARIIFWHWNPIKTDKEKKIIFETKNMCEHWTFNHYDAKKYGMKLNNQFFFYQKYSGENKMNSAFFVGVDKGRYHFLNSLAKDLEKKNIIPDFYVVDQNHKGRFYQKQYMEYEEVLNHLKTTKFVVELCQSGQSGLTTRALEAMFFGVKLITNNLFIKECEFYKKENIYIIGEKGFEEFLVSPFVKIEKEKLYPYSVNGWIDNFLSEG